MTGQPGTPPYEPEGLAQLLADWLSERNGSYRLIPVAVSKYDEADRHEADMRLPTSLLAFEIEEVLRQAAAWRGYVATRRAIVGGDDG